MGFFLCPIENGDFPMSFVSFQGARFLGHVLKRSLKIHRIAKYVSI